MNDVKPEYLDVEIVVIADAHNPTILNPDFLSHNDIVPKTWGWNTKDAIVTTPAFSQVSYSNEVSIIVEPPRMRVIDHARQESPTQSRIADIVRAYVSVLRHVKYTAIGTNFRMFLPMERPEEYLKLTFVKEGPWCSGQRVLLTAGLQFVYALPEGGRVRMDLSSGARTLQAGQQEAGIVFRSNFHRDCAALSKDDIVKYVGCFVDDWEMNWTLVMDILGQGEISQ